MGSNKNPYELCERCTEPAEAMRAINSALEGGYDPKDIYSGFSYALKEIKGKISPGNFKRIFENELEDIENPSFKNFGSAGSESGERQMPVERWRFSRLKNPNFDWRLE